MSSSKIWVVVPAFNEADVLAQTLSDLLSHFQKIVVVDDCSTDGTGDIALARGAYVCRHPINLGQGAAIQTGIAFALAAGADYVITFDADGQHRPEDAEAMLAELIRSKADVVLGSRFLGAAMGISRTRKMLLKAAVLFTRLSTGLKITDAHNGLRAFTGAAAAKIKLRQNRMAHASEILEQIARHGLRYGEHPVTIVYTDYSRAKGQRIIGAARIMLDLFLRRLYR